jgi:hypothetical protein
MAGATSTYSPNETMALEQFVAGGPVEMGWFHNWLTMIREAAAEGRRFTRVLARRAPHSEGV